MTFWLAPRPTYRIPFHFNISEESDFEQTINRLQQLSLHNVIRNSISLYNNYRLLTFDRQFPYEQTQQQPLSQKLVESLLNSKECWWGSTAIDGTSMARGHCQRENHSKRLRRLRKPTFRTTEQPLALIMTFRLAPASPAPTGEKNKHHQRQWIPTGMAAE